MAVERAGALLSHPKLEDKHPESTSMRDLTREMHFDTHGRVKL